MMRYRVEVNDGAGWRLVFGTDGESKGYCMGYVTAMSTCPGPRLAYRAVRHDGRVVMDAMSKADVSIGQVAGFPTAEQYEAAGNAALEKARQIRARNR